MSRSRVEASRALVRRTGASVATSARVIAADREQVAVVGLLWLAGFVGTVVCFQVVLEGVVMGDLHAMLPQWVEDRMAIVQITPAWILVMQMRIGVVVGLVLATPGVLYYGSDWLRRRGRWPESEVPTGVAALVGLGWTGLFAAGVGVASLVVVPILVDVLTGPTPSSSTVLYLVYRWFQLVAVVCLSTGLAAATPFLAGVAARSGVVTRKTVGRDALGAAVFVVAFGLLLWEGDPFLQVAWSGPLLASLAVSVAVVAVGSPIRS